MMREPVEALSTEHVEDTDTWKTTFIVCPFADCVDLVKIVASTDEVTDISLHIGPYHISHYTTAVLELAGKKKVILDKGIVVYTVPVQIPLMMLQLMKIRIVVTTSSRHCGLSCLTNGTMLDMEFRDMLSHGHDSILCWVTRCISMPIVCENYRFPKLFDYNLQCQFNGILIQGENIGAINRIAVLDQGVSTDYNQSALFAFAQYLRSDA